MHPTFRYSPAAIREPEDAVPAGGLPAEQPRYFVANLLRAG